MEQKKCRKIFRKTLILTAVSLGLTGCGSDQQGTEGNLKQSEIYEETQQPQGTGIKTDGGKEENDDLIVVGLSQLGSESDWRIANTESYRSTLTPENGYYLLYENAQQKQENQLKALRNFILQEVDYIVVAPIVETGWEPVLQEARAAGIPVILADRTVAVEDDDLYSCYVGGNFVREAEDAGRWLDDYLQKQGREEEEINIVTLQGTPGASAELGRTAGFQNILEQHPNWKMLEIKSGDFTQARGQEVMEYFLDTYDAIDVVICQNDNMAFGAIDAIQAAGKTCGPDGEIILLSFDAVSAAFDCMIQGKINADFECNPLHGPLVDQIIKDLEAGKSVDKIQYVEETYFDTTMDLEKIKEERRY